jgi:hypothetical protein
MPSATARPRAITTAGRISFPERGLFTNLIKPDSGKGTQTFRMAMTATGRMPCAMPPSALKPDARPPARSDPSRARVTPALTAPTGSTHVIIQASNDGIFIRTDITIAPSRPLYLFRIIKCDYV